MNLSSENIGAVILAGGFGKRLRSVLSDLPKPMAPVLGKPFVEWVVRYLAVHGIRKIVISTGYLAEKVSEHFQERPVEGVSVRCVVENQPLGTAGGFLNAAEACGENCPAWMVLNGDSLAFGSLPAMANELSEPSVSGVIMGVMMNDASRYGAMAENADGALIGFEEKRAGAGRINAGIYLLRTSLLERFPSQRPLSFETDVFPALLARGACLKVYATEGPFLDIGTPESLAEAERFIGANRKEFG